MRSKTEQGNWKQKGLALIGGGLGALLVAGLGLYSFLTAMRTQLYTDPQAVPSVTNAAPLQKWTDAVAQGRQLARAGLVEQNLPGLSVAIGIDGEIVWAEGFGWADFGMQVPVTPGTRFRIGHASKPVTSAAVGLLLEKGQLRLEDEIQTYVPAFPRKQRPVTLRQLMGHVSGVRHYRDEADYMPSAHCARASEGLQPFAEDPLRFEPGTQYGYSTFGWILVSAAVESAAGEPFSTFMRTQVFDPLGMADTTFDSAIAPDANRATFYYQRFNGDPRPASELEAKVDYSCFAGAGAILSTPSDLVRFGNAIGSGKLLQSDTVAGLRRPQRLTSGEQTAYGLGWMLETAELRGEPTRMAGHANRTLLGGSTSFLTFPERGIVVAVATNIGGKYLKSIAWGIAEAFAERRAAEGRVIDHWHRAIRRRVEGMDRPMTRSDPAMTKIEYQPLLKYLRDRYANTVVLTFQEIDDVLGAPLPEAAHRLLAWWTDPQADGSPSVQSLAWTNAGRTATPNFLARTVRFERVSL